MIAILLIINIIVSVATLILTVWIYQKNDELKRSINIKEFQDKKSLETPIIDDKQKLATTKKEKKTNTKFISPNSDKPFQSKGIHRKENNIEQNKNIISSISKSEPTNKHSTIDDTYIFLEISFEGELVRSDSISYYRAWQLNNILYYEFFCDKSEIAMTINNRSSLLAPFCNIDSSSENPDRANSICSIKPGILDKNSYTVIEKTIIKFE